MKTFEDYAQVFCDEDFCIQFIRRLKEESGIICPKCDNHTHYWKKDKKKFECKKCTHRTSLKKGTVMENSNLPLRYWFLVIAYLSMNNNGISALQVQKELQHNRYEPVLRMVKKVKLLPDNDLLKQSIIRYIHNTYKS
jgi:hypothetical protein